MNKKGKESPFFIDRTGERWKTNEGYWVTIIEYFGANNFTIQFEDGTILKNIVLKNLKIGNVTNPYHPSLYGIGYRGIGKFKTKINGKLTIEYRKWSNIFARCYDETIRHKTPTYIDCSVNIKWHCFQDFAQWFEENYVEGWELDKDILVKGNKIYSPENCCFVPQEINTQFKVTKKGLLSGIEHKGNIYITQIDGYRSFSNQAEALHHFKNVKENKLKILAEKHKKGLNTKVYEILKNYKF